MARKPDASAATQPEGGRAPIRLMVEPTGAFMLVDPYTRVEIQHNRPTVVRASPFIDVRLGNGQLRLVSAKLPDDVTDEMFHDWFVASDRKVALAVESFLAKYEMGRPPVEEKPPADPKDKKVE